MKNISELEITASDDTDGSGYFAWVCIGHPRGEDDPVLLVPGEVYETSIIGGAIENTIYLQFSYKTSVGEEFEIGDFIPITKEEYRNGEPLYFAIRDSCKEPKSWVCTKRDTPLQSRYKTQAGSKP